MEEDSGLKKQLETARDAAASSLAHITGLVKALGFGGPAVLMCSLLMVFLVRNENAAVVSRVWPDIWWAWKGLVGVWLVSTGLSGAMVGFFSWRASRSAAAAVLEKPAAGQYDLLLSDPATGQQAKVRMTVNEAGQVEASVEEPKKTA